MPPAETSAASFTFTRMQFASGSKGPGISCPSNEWTVVSWRVRVSACMYRGVSE